MGLLDQLAGQLFGGSSSAGNTGAGGSELVALALQLLQNHPGGLNGLLQQLSGSGLGDQVQSWVGTGANQAVSGEQLASALGPDTLATLAARLGLDPATAASGLAQVLPQVVDTATPDGSLDDADNRLQEGLSSLGGLFH